MPYHSTRGRARELPFDDVLLAGLAPDGGLYMPTAWPALSAAEVSGLSGLSYAELAARVMLPYLDGTILAGEFLGMVADSYRGFDHQAVAPLVQLGPAEWLLELFHGPTLSFKDYALQLVGRLFEHVLRRKGRRATILVATSGDTGSAAIEACRDQPSIDIVVLHPKGRVSEVQRRQMTTVRVPNVHNIAIEGSFDDCQTLVKAMFNDAALRTELSLSAMNSINWARIMAQIPYYAAAAVALGAPERPLAFAVPTGNFGNVFAAFAARRMDLPVVQLVVGSNANDILTRFFESGEMRRGAVVPTLAPSMDIQVSSNFERYLHELHGGDAARVAARMDEFHRTGLFALEPSAMREARALFDGHRLDDAGAIAAMRGVFRETGMLVDPHTAIGIAAGRARRRHPDLPLVAVATAHPAKFPEAVQMATGRRPELPPRLADLFERKECYDVKPCDLGVIAAHIRGCVRAAA